jgi:hypothetical protein
VRCWNCSRFRVQNRAYRRATAGPSGPRTGAAVAVLSRLLVGLGTPVEVASKASTRLAGDPVAVPVHLLAIARLIGVDRCHSGSPGGVTAGVICALQWRALTPEIARKGDRLRGKLSGLIVVEDETEYSRRCSRAFSPNETPFCELGAAPRR